MFSRRSTQIGQLKAEVQELRSRLTELQTKHASVDRRIDRITKINEYRVTREGDVWKAIGVRDAYSHGMFNEVHDGPVAFGATKASAVKKLKAELLAGTSPSFVERTHPPLR